MKAKNVKKKLVLSKETVAILATTELNAVHGGYTAYTFPPGCETNYPGICTMPDCCVYTYECI